MTVAARIPNIAVGLVAGGLADRLDRRWTMLAVQVLRFTVIAAVAALALAGLLSMPDPVRGRVHHRDRRDVLRHERARRSSRRWWAATDW